jgi:transcriptional regulator with XRE-family HTH domain
MNNQTSPLPETTVAGVIRKHRGLLKLSTREFAALLNMSQNMVSLMERGINEPSRETLSEWFAGKNKLRYKIAVDIYVARYREALTQHRPTDLEPA